MFWHRRTDRGFPGSCVRPCAHPAPGWEKKSAGLLNKRPRPKESAQADLRIRVRVVHARLRAFAIRPTALSAPRLLSSRELAGEKNRGTIERRASLLMKVGSD